MSASFRRFEILLPRWFNDGQPVPDALIVDVLMELEAPGDLLQAVAAAPKALAMWSNITPLARRNWIQWITSGKRAETWVLRIQKASDMLAAGKRRPCCFDRSGMYIKSISCPVAEI